MSSTVFNSIISSVATAFLALMLARVAAIATARRAAYSTIASKLVELWRAGTPRKNEIFAELAKLVVDGNAVLYPALERFVDAINDAQPEAELMLLDLLDQMRSTSFLARVRESFVSSGPSQIELLGKLLKK